MDPSEHRSLVETYSKIELMGTQNFLPLDENTKIAAFSIVHEGNIDSGVEFFNFLAQIFKNDCDFGFIDEEATLENLTSLRSGISEAEVVIFAFFLPSDYMDDDAIKVKIINIIEHLSEDKRSIGVFFSQNFIPNEINLPVAIILPTIDTPSIAAAAMYLAGRKP